MEVRNHEKTRESKNNLGGVDKQSIFREKEWYRDKIVEMIEEIDNEDYIISIYSFVKVFFED